MNGRRNLLPQDVQLRLDRVRNFNGIRARLAQYRKCDRACTCIPSGSLVILNAVRDRADIRQPHRGTIAIGYDERPETVGIR